MAINPRQGRVAVVVELCPLMETTYKPHSYAEPISLPQIPASVSLSATSGGSGLQQWFRGLSSTPVAHFSPEAIEIVEERWKVKWEYYNQTFREEAEQAALDDMPRRELYKHVERLEAEFERLRSRFMEIDSAKASAEVTTGVQFVLSLIEAQTPEIYQIKATELNESQDNEQLKALRQQVKAIDRVHKFALQSSDAVHRIKVLELLGSRTKKTTEGRLDSGDLEKGSRSSTEIASPSGAASPVQSASDLPNNKGNQKVQFTDPEISSGPSGSDSIYPPPGPSTIPVPGKFDAAPTNITIMANSRYQSDRPSGSNARQARPQRRGNSYEAPAPAPAPTQALSTAESHR
ncbi:hypothetical protein FRC12_011819 [Ceratobasidium sp. 428]|nr:hypothetical protein FRC12_011819 [Ceratobasidium sp. 428]